jgi:hypothetical protein
MAFNKVVSLIIGKGEETEIQSQGVEMNNLDIVFDIIRSRTFEENSAEFVIYNLSRETRNSVLRKGSAVIFSAGYEDDGVGVVFIGAISESKTEMEGGNIKTTIQAISASGKNNLDNIVVNLGFSKGVTVAEVLDKLSTITDLVIFGREQANIMMDNGFFYSGSARGAFKRLSTFLALNKVKIMIDNGEIVLFNLNGADSRFDTGILDHKSGLFSAHEIISENPAELDDKMRIEVNSILLPKVRPNSLIKIEGNNINGFFICDKVQFFGSNFGDEFNCKMEMVE